MNSASDTQSITSKASHRSYLTTTQGYDKVCRYCGRGLTNKRWGEHMLNHHKGKDRLEWTKGETLLGECWCDNWIDVLAGTAPIGIKKSYKRSRVSALIIHNVQSLAESAEEEKGEKKCAAFFEQYEQDIQQDNPDGMDMLDSRSKEAIATTFLQSQSQYLQESPVQDLFGGLGKRAPTAILEEEIPATKRQNCTNQSVSAPVSAPVDGFKQPTTSYSHVISLIKKLAETDIKQDTAKQLAGMSLSMLVEKFLDAEVMTYIRDNKKTLGTIKELLIDIQRHVKPLPINAVASISLLAIIFGDGAWTNIHKMYTQLAEKKLAEVFELMSPFMQSMFNAKICRWFFDNWKFLESQTLSLMDYLNTYNELADQITCKISNELAASILSLSKGVVITENKSFVTVSQHFSRYPLFKAALSAVQEPIKSYHQMTNNQLPQAEFVQLITTLTDDRQQSLLESKKGQLEDQLLNNWPGLIKTWQDVAFLDDSPDVGTRLGKLNEESNVLSKKKLKSLRPEYKHLFAQVSNSPNDLQFANAQFAVLTLSHFQKQLWSIPSGQGKSRILHTMALLLLHTNTADIHILYHTKHLKERDQKEFGKWWQLYQLTERVKYHHDLSFTFKATDVILIDEADELLFNSPAAFIGKFKASYCICVTATPYTKSGGSVEEEVIKQMKFKSLQGWTDVPKNTVMINEDENLQVNDLQLKKDETLIEHINSLLDNQAVILYCAPAMIEQLKEAKMEHIELSDDSSVDDDQLRALYHKVNDKYRLVVITSELCMRGFDFRAQNNSITLIIAASFSNRRSLLQGLNRVGRFGDSCKRFKTAGIELVDSVKQMNYYTKLNSYIHSLTILNLKALTPLGQPKNKENRQQQEQQEQQVLKMSNARKSTLLQKTFR